MQHETLKRSLRHSSEASPVNPFFWGTDGQRRPPKPWPDSPLHHHFAWIFATSQIRKGVPLRTVGWREISMLRCCVCIIDILGYFSDAGSLNVRVLFLQPRYKVLGVWEFPMQALGLTSFKSMSGFDTICYQYVDFEARDEQLRRCRMKLRLFCFLLWPIRSFVLLKTQKLRIWWQRIVCWTQPARAACWITIWLLSFVINMLALCLPLGNPTGQPWRQHPWNWPVARDVQNMSKLLTALQNVHWSLAAHRTSFPPCFRSSSANWSGSFPPWNRTWVLCAEHSGLIETERILYSKWIKMIQIEQTWINMNKFWTNIENTGSLLCILLRRSDCKCRGA